MRYKRRVRKYRRKRGGYKVRPEGMIKEKIINIYDITMKNMQIEGTTNTYKDAFFNIHHTRKGATTETANNAYFSDPIPAGQFDKESDPT